MAVRPGVGIVPTYVPNIHTSTEIFSYSYVRSPVCPAVIHK